LFDERRRKQPSDINAKKPAKDDNSLYRGAGIKAQKENKNTRSREGEIHVKGSASAKKGKAMKTRKEVRRIR